MNPESIYIDKNEKLNTLLIQKLNENGNQQPKKTEAGNNEPKRRKGQSGEFILLSIKAGSISILIREKTI